MSNEAQTTQEQMEVYFDDFKVTHTKSPVVQQDEYYPFGLTFNGYQRENSTKNNYLYNSKELQDELNIGWMDYGARMYMPEIGRWGVLDGLTEDYHSWGGYVYALNRPSVNVDYGGLAPFDPIKNLVIPNNPNEVDPQIWKPNPNYKAPGSMQWIDKNGNKLTFDQGTAGSNGWKGTDHWHYEDANGSRYNSQGKISRAFGHDESHLSPGTETEIPLNKKPNSLVTRNKFRGGSRGMASRLGSLGNVFGLASFGLDIFRGLSGDPHSLGMQFTEGYSDNKLYYNENADVYWDRKKGADVKNEAGEVIGTEYTFSIYAEYSYDDKQGKYVGSGDKRSVTTIKYEGEEAKRQFILFLEGGYN